MTVSDIIDATISGFSANAFVELHLAPSDRVFANSGDYEFAGFYPYVDFYDEKNVHEIYGNVGLRLGHSPQRKPNFHE